jgi:hypothetical protein
MTFTHRFYEQDWREAMDRLEAQTSLCKKLMAEWTPGDSQDHLNVEFKWLVELAGSFPSPPSDSASEAR